MIIWWRLLPLCDYHYAIVSILVVSIQDRLPACHRLAFSACLLPATCFFCTLLSLHLHHTFLPPPPSSFYLLPCFDMVGFNQWSNKFLVLLLMFLKTYCCWFIPNCHIYWSRHSFSCSSSLKPCSFIWLRPLQRFMLLYLHSIDLFSTLLVLNMVLHSKHTSLLMTCLWFSSVSSSHQDILHWVLRSGRTSIIQYEFVLDCFFGYLYHYLGQCFIQQLLPNYILSGWVLALRNSHAFYFTRHYIGTLSMII